MALSNEQITISVLLKAFKNAAGVPVSVEQWCCQRNQQLLNNAAFCGLGNQKMEIKHAPAHAGK